MRVPGLWSFGLPLTSPLYEEEYVRSRGVRATARGFGKLIKLKCLTGNDAKVKETPRKALLAPTSPGVRRRLSADVDERWWGRWENWIVTVDFAACISRRECSFNNSTTPGTAVCVCLVLQRFQYLISAEWDRGLVRACFHWNKTKKKKVWILAILWIGHYSQLCRCQETNFILDHGKGLFIPSCNAFYFQNSFNQAKKKKPKVALFCTLTKVRLILRGSHLFFFFFFFVI